MRSLRSTRSDLADLARPRLAGATSPGWRDLAWRDLARLQHSGSVVVSRVERGGRRPRMGAGAVHWGTES